VLELLVAILAGQEHLQDISRAAHPLDNEQNYLHPQSKRQKDVF
jgi:hypothetical protein